MTAVCPMEATAENKAVGEETGLVRTMGTRLVVTRGEAHAPLSLLQYESWGGLLASFVLRLTGCGRPISMENFLVLPQLFPLCSA